MSQAAKNNICQKCDAVIMILEKKIKSMKKFKNFVEEYEKDETLEIPEPCEKDDFNGFELFPNSSIKHLFNFKNGETPEIMHYEQNRLMNDIYNETIKMLNDIYYE